MSDNRRPINLDEHLHNADWPKRTPDRWEDLERKIEEEADDAGDHREP
jgi:hypothetical protein